MLVLNGRDLEAVLTTDELLQAVEKVLQLYEGDGFSMPPRMHAEFEGKVLLLMPAFTPHAMGTKLVSIFPDNPAMGIPAVQGLMALNDASTGIPVALMDAAVLTGLRTGAVGAMGVRLLAPEGAGTLGIVGAGVQARYLAMLTFETGSFERLIISDVDEQKSVKLASMIREKSSCTVQIASTGREVLEASDVVITATTSKFPVLPGDASLLEGRTFIGIGSFKPEMREYPPELYPLLDKVYIDSWQAVEESGDIATALRSGQIRKDQIRTLGSLLNTPGEIPVGNTQFFKSVGMALFDLIVASEIFKAAKKRGLGTDIDFP